MRDKTAKATLCRKQRFQRVGKWVEMSNCLDIDGRQSNRAHGPSLRGELKMSKWTQAAVEVRTLRNGVRAVTKGYRQIANFRFGRARVLDQDCRVGKYRMFGEDGDWRESKFVQSAVRRLSRKDD